MLEGVELEFDKLAIDAIVKLKLLKEKLVPEH